MFGLSCNVLDCRELHECKFFKFTIIVTW